MTYLYGDSSDSGLELNYIELLREFLDFAVQVMLSEHRIATSRLGADDAKRKATVELDRLRSLGAAITATLEKSKSQNTKSVTDQSIQAIHTATDATLRRAAESLKQSVANNEKELLTSRGRERAGNAKLIEPLLLNHRLPDSESSANVEIDADGQSYAAEVLGSCKQGLAWRFAANIPDKHFYKETIKISSFDPELTISLPEMSGFVRKSVKLKPYRLFPLFLTSVKHVGKDILVQLRSTASPQDDTGIDIRVQAVAPRVCITRLHKGEQSAPFDAPGDDAKKLLEMIENFSKKTNDLIEQRSRLIDVRFDKQPLANCNEPTTLVTRLIQRLGPVVTKIAEHSLAESELVLKRVLDNGRREEIFASKADMLTKISAIPKAARWVFAPLGLGELADGMGENDPTIPVDGLAAIEDDPLAAFDDDDDDEEQTKVPGVLPDPAIVTQEISEIIALAPDEADDDDDLTEMVRSRPMPQTRARASQAPPVKAPPAPPRPPARTSAPAPIAPMASRPTPLAKIKPTPPARGAAAPPVSLTTPPNPSGDSIDIALSELEADS
tara:strand:+ start:66962 stop:68629 length:1668 start_codon:yes stop_codon:yes gene_type:complete